jgi:hypothetical protein
VSLYAWVVTGLGAYLGLGTLTALGVGLILRRFGWRDPHCEVCARADAVLDHHPELIPSWPA